jgi:undecaprenyl-diphosphatase
LPLIFRLSTPLLVHISTPYSFPSGHALRTTFLFALLTEKRPYWRIVGWLGIGAMAFTRIYCNDHWVSDVVGGALLGGALAAVAAASVPTGVKSTYR